MSEIRKLVPVKLNEKFKQLFDVVEEIYDEEIENNKVIEIIKNLYNVHYNLPLDVLNKLLTQYNSS